VLASIFRVGLWLARLPNQRTALAIARWAAAILQWVNADAAKVTRTNLQTCFPELEAGQLDALCRQSLIHMVLLVFEFAQLNHWSEEKLLGQIDSVAGKSLLDEAYAAGRGVVLLVPHFGNWELLCAFLGAHYNFAALYDPPKIASIERVIIGARKRFQGEFFAIDTSGMRGLLRVLKQGKLVAILPDQVPDRNAGVYVDFFNQPALTMTLPHRLIAKNQPAVLLGSVQRLVNDEGFTYQLRFEAISEELATSDPETCARMINQSIEQVVQRAPAQYQWEYKRFKRPAGWREGNIYRRQ
jgi:KDO2-lipid IV(A) lauroyltransferase